MGPALCKPGHDGSGDEDSDGASNGDAPPLNWETSKVLSVNVAGARDAAAKRRVSVEVVEAAGELCRKVGVGCYEHVFEHGTGLTLKFRVYGAEGALVGTASLRLPYEKLMKLVPAGETLTLPVTAVPARGGGPNGKDGERAAFGRPDSPVFNATVTFDQAVGISRELKKADRPGGAEDVAPVTFTVRTGVELHVPHAERGRAEGMRKTREHHASRGWADPSRPLNALADLLHTPPPLRAAPALAALGLHHPFPPLDAFEVCAVGVRVVTCTKTGKKGKGKTRIRYEQARSHVLRKVAFHIDGALVRGGEYRPPAVLTAGYPKVDADPSSPATGNPNSEWLLPSGAAEPESAVLRCGVEWPPPEGGAPPFVTIGAHVSLAEATPAGAAAEGEDDKSRAGKKEKKEKKKKKDGVDPVDFAADRYAVLRMDPAMLCAAVCAPAKLALPLVPEGEYRAALKAPTASLGFPALCNPWDMPDETDDEEADTPTAPLKGRKDKKSTEDEEKKEKKRGKKEKKEKKGKKGQEEDKEEKQSTKKGKKKGKSKAKAEGDAEFDDDGSLRGWAVGEHWKDSAPEGTGTVVRQWLYVMVRSSWKELSAKRGADPPPAPVGDTPPLEAPESTPPLEAAEPPPRGTSPPGYPPPPGSLGGQEDPLAAGPASSAPSASRDLGPAPVALVPPAAQEDKTTAQLATLVDREILPEVSSAEEGEDPLDGAVAAVGRYPRAAAGAVEQLSAAEAEARLAAFFAAVGRPGKDARGYLTMAAGRERELLQLLRAKFPVEAERVAFLEHYNAKDGGGEVEKANERRVSYAPAGSEADLSMAASEADTLDFHLDRVLIAGGGGLATTRADAVGALAAFFASVGKEGKNAGRFLDAAAGREEELCSKLAALYPATAAPLDTVARYGRERAPRPLSVAHPADPLLSRGPVAFPTPPPPQVDDVGPLSGPPRLSVTYPAAPLHAPAAVGGTAGTLDVATPRGDEYVASASPTVYSADAASPSPELRRESVEAADRMDRLSQDVKRFTGTCARLINFQVAREQRKRQGSYPASAPAAAHSGGGSFSPALETPRAYPRDPAPTPISLPLRPGPQPTFNTPPAYRPDAGTAASPAGTLGAHVHSPMSPGGDGGGSTGFRDRVLRGVVELKGGVVESSVSVEVRNQTVMPPPLGTVSP